MNVNEYNKCVDEYADAVYRFIYKNIRSKEKSRDIVQDAFEKLWIKVTSIDYTKSKSYLFTTAYHCMVDMLRKEKFQGDFGEIDEQEYLLQSTYNDLKDVLDVALSKLNEIQRSVVLLRDYEGYSYEEIGKITRLNEAQVKVYLYRARVFLKQYIGKLDSVI